MSASQVGSPFAWPLVGHLPQFLWDKLGFLTRCARRFPTATRLRLGDPTVLLGVPEDVYHVMVSNHTSYGRSQRISSRKGLKLLGESLFTMESGEAHRERRRLTSHAFQPQRLTGVVEPMLTSIDGWLERSSGELEICHEMRLLAQRMGGFALLGVDLHAEARDLGLALLLRQDYVRHYYTWVLPLARQLPFPVVVRHRRALRVMEESFADLIRRRREAPGADLLSSLVTARFPEDGRPLSQAELMGELFTLGVAVFEALTDALAWTWYLLAQHPEVESRLREQVESELRGGAPGLDVMNRVPYCDMVVSESLRIYPPTWLYIRMAHADDVLPSGVRVAAGTKIYICPWVLHRDPRYFSDPERFDPERFREPGRHSTAYVPFGVGPRICIGQRLARAMIGMVICRVMQQRRLVLVPGQKIRPAPRVTLNPLPGIRMRCERCPAPVALR